MVEQEPNTAQFYKPRMDLRVGARFKERVHRVAGGIAVGGLIATGVDAFAGWVLTSGFDTAADPGLSSLGVAGLAAMGIGGVVYAVTAPEKVEVDA